MKRRSFLEFLGAGTAGIALGGHLNTLARGAVVPGAVAIKGIKPTSRDELVLARKLRYDVLVSWQDAISDTEKFGFNNDFTAFLPADDKSGLLWVNHEYVDPLFVSGYDVRYDRTRAQVDEERYNVGGSLVAIERNGKGQWAMSEDTHRNKRITGTTPIPFAWDSPIYGATESVGMVGNCSGGVTPWGTILTCEENFDMFYGERIVSTGELKDENATLGWHKYYDHPPEHYGWVVEVDPAEGSARKLVSLGRCAHECATVKELADGRIVVYMGDDAINQCLYKFIGDTPGSLTSGTLYVANVQIGKWIPIVYDESEVLQKFFKDQTEVLIRLRIAARYLGGTPLDRPEDIEIDPVTGHVVISLTNNVAKKNYFGSILKIEEENGDHESLTFKPSTFLTGGPETGFACPDNLAFDKAGNLWFASDISTTYLNRPPYEEFGNNGLFVVPRTGPQAGEVIQVGSAPVGAELTGPWFTDDGSTLFLSVQHPGESTLIMEQLTSHWPDGGDKIPRPSVVAITGDLLADLQG